MIQEIADTLANGGGAGGDAVVGIGEGIAAALGAVSLWLAQNVRKWFGKLSR